MTNQPKTSQQSTTICASHYSEPGA